MPHPRASTTPSPSEVASILLDPEENAAQRARVPLQDGEELQLERSGDLGPGNAGLLVFVDRAQRPEYVPWTEVEQVDNTPLVALRRIVPAGSARVLVKM